jgi:cytochrome c556
MYSGRAPSLPQKFYTGEVDAFWRSETSFEESRQHYLTERDKLRKAHAEKQQQDAGVVKASTPAAGE